MIITNKTHKEFQPLSLTNALILKNLSNLILFKTINHHRIRWRNNGPTIVFKLQYVDHWMGVMEGRRQVQSIGIVIHNRHNPIWSNPKGQEFGATRGLERQIAGAQQNIITNRKGAV